MKKLFLIALILTFTLSINIGLADTLILYYPFSEGSGSTTSDNSGYGHTGTLNWYNSSRLESIGFVDNCISGNCIKTDGTGGWISVSDNSSLDLSAWTISVWVKFTSEQDRQQILYKGTTSDNNYKLELMNHVPLISGKKDFVCSFRDTGETVRVCNFGSSGSVDKDTWTYLTCSYNSSTGMKLYKNNALVKTCGYNTNPKTNNGYLNISYASGIDNWLNASIDNLKIYNTELNLSQIDTDYNNVDNCFTINSSGSYTLNHSINSINYKEYCVLINASNVILDLNGYTIRDLDSGTSKGIASNYYHDNITIKNGEVTGFTYGIYNYFWYSYFYIRNMTLRANDYGIYSVTYYTDTYPNLNFEISESNFIDNQYGLHSLGNISNFLIENNTFYSINNDFIGSFQNGLIKDNNFGNIVIYSGPSCCKKFTNTIKNKFFGYFTGETEICFKEDFSSCGYYGTGSNIAMILNFISDVDFYANKFTSRVSLSNSFNNRFIFNEIILTDTAFSENNGLWLYDTTRDNSGCGNNFLLFDFGINNTFISICPTNIIGNVTNTTAKWFCLNNNVSAYITEDYQVLSKTECPYGCENGKCRSETIGINPNTNFGLLTGITGILGFVTKPMTIFTILLIIGSVVIDKVVKAKGKVIPIIFVIGLILFSFMGIYPIWISIVMIIIAVGYVAYLFRNIVND